MQQDQSAKKILPRLFVSSQRKVESSYARVGGSKNQAGTNYWRLELRADKLTDMTPERSISLEQFRFTVTQLNLSIDGFHLLSPVAGRNESKLAGSCTFHFLPFLCPVRATSAPHKTSSTTTNESTTAAVLLGGRKNSLLHQSSLHNAYRQILELTGNDNKHSDHRQSTRNGFDLRR